MGYQIGDPEWKWRTGSTITKIAYVAVNVSVASCFLAWAVLAYADQQVLGNPVSPAGAYTYPHEAKGVVRFVASDLDHLLRVGSWMMKISLTSLLLSGALWHWLLLRAKRHRTIP